MLFDPDRPNLYEKVNALRTTPEVFIKKFDVVSKALSRTRKNNKEAQELEALKNFLLANKGISLPPFELSYGLCKACEAIIKTIIQTGNEHYSITKDIIEKLANSYLDKHQDLFYISDYGDLDYFVIRMLISSHDTERTYKKAVFSSRLKYIGFASRDFQDEEINIVLLAEDVKEKSIDDDESELKEIFDILDHEGKDLIEPSLIKDAMLALQYDIKNFKFVEIMEQFEEIMVKDKHREGIDFDTFKKIISQCYIDAPPLKRNRKEWRKIFDLFVDDSKAETISIQNIKRISLHLEEQLEPDDIKKFMKWACNNGSELTFDEFYNIMTI